MTELDSYPYFNVRHALGLTPPVATSKGIDFTSDQIRKAWRAASLHWLGNNGSTMNVTMLGNPLRTSRRSSGRLLAVDPRLSDPDEREELFRVMGIEEVVTPKKKKGKVDMSNHFIELELFDAKRPRITKSFLKIRKDE
ncbi:hypothetical protein CGCTS75_v007042 [Colletotrichum tropicale]|nr:hypothetical protein CGCTS75_v007042 [Colletotrichum tropicale]